MQAKIDPAALYLQLSQLIATTPDLAALEGQPDIPPAINAWLGDVYACVAATGELFDSMQIQRNTPLLLNCKVSNLITGALYRAYGVAKLRAPAAVVNSFIAVGNHHDAYKAIGAALSEADNYLLIIDPYLDQTMINDFVPLVKERTLTRLLTGDVTKWMSTLGPASTRWIQQYGVTRPLEVRSTATGQLHDRAILLGDGSGYAVSQSFKDIAKKSPATIIRFPVEIAAMKQSAYELIWSTAQSVV